MYSEGKIMRESPLLLRVAAIWGKPMTELIVVLTLILLMMLIVIGRKKEVG